MYWARKKQRSGFTTEMRELENCLSETLSITTFKANIKGRQQVGSAGTSGTLEISFLFSDKKMEVYFIQSIDGSSINQRMDSWFVHKECFGMEVSGLPDKNATTQNFLSLEWNAFCAALKDMSYYEPILSLQTLFESVT